MLKLGMEVIVMAITNRLISADEYKRKLDINTVLSIFDAFGLVESFPTFRIEDSEYKVSKSNVNYVMPFVETIESWNTVDLELNENTKKKVA